MNVYNGDGNHRTLQSNVIDIMSMANVYTYYHNIEDYDLFLSYAKNLLSNSHSYTVSMSDVYYCSGECLDHEDEEEGEEWEEELDPADWEESATAVIHNYATPSDLEGTLTDSSSGENPSDTNDGSSVIIAGVSAKASTDPANPSDSGSEISSSETTNSETTGSETTGNDNSRSMPARSRATLSDAEKTCPGHIDLTINVRIYGIEENNSLFERDTIGNTASEEEDCQWKGWGEEERSYVKSLKERDWYEDYGLTLSAFTLGNPLTQSEIQEYLNQLPSGLSQERKAVVEFALSSVGKVPYYWGGKASRPGYEGNNFGIVVESDQEGRVFKGLDCSGWISWVYWSAIGERLPYESTAGLVSLGKSISKYEMQPGDIALRTGDNAHVIMFLGWTDDGRILCVHESSDGVNNVTVAVKNDNWTNYRNILD